MKFRILSITKGVALFKMIRTIFILIAILGIVFSTIGLWQEHHQLEPILGELGGKLFNPIYNLYESSSNIAESGFYINTGSLFSDIGNFFKNIYSVFEPIIFIYITMYYIYLFSLNVLVGDSSRRANALMISLIIFILLQFLYIKTFTDLPLKTPFDAIGNMLGILSDMFKN